jgi:hypothetical protein
MWTMHVLSKLIIGLKGNPLGMMTSSFTILSATEGVRLGHVSGVSMMTTGYWCYYEHDTVSPYPVPK